MNDAPSSEGRSSRDMILIAHGEPPAAQRPVLTPPSRRGEPCLPSGVPASHHHRSLLQKLELVQMARCSSFPHSRTRRHGIRTGGIRYWLSPSVDPYHSSNLLTVDVDFTDLHTSLGLAVMLIAFAQGM